MHRGPAAYVLGPPPSRGRYLELEGGVNAYHVEYVYTYIRMGWAIFTAMDVATPPNHVIGMLEQLIGMLRMRHVTSDTSGLPDG